MTSGFLTPDTQNALLQASQSGSSQSNKSLRDAKNAKEVEQAAIDFEAVFISEMMKPMFDGIEAEAPFHGGQGEEIFKSMITQEYGKLISQSGSIGVSHAVKDMMIKMQGGDTLGAHMNGDDLAMSPEGTNYASFSPEQLNAIEPGGNNADTAQHSDALNQILNSLTNNQ
jgi:flagellar protein FlgJ